ncbi:HNH endonuclease [Neptuniibacter halophilus]|uniref:HNH endonuclease n=1 Tax=Neptuniibacter halophilus TaxID=651666 RepID=UPI002572BEFC|nr:HNH endonuclease [Neptuniibacter halophilus]
MQAVITENDESQWDDQTGSLYHFPKRYQKYLLPGTEVLYYKGKIKNLQYRDKRLDDAPHYFAKAVIGKVYPDRSSDKGDLFATIIDYAPFTVPIMAKTDGTYLETIPDNQKSNYWRNGVRPIDTTGFERILSQLEPNQVITVSELEETEHPLNDSGYQLESGSEGKPNQRFVTTYERNIKYRQQAIAIHGLTCAACNFNFKDFYGDYADGFIHIHHIVPVSTLDQPTLIDPETDLVPLCANCHAVVHRKQSQTLSIDELKGMIQHAKASSATT